MIKDQVHTRFKLFVAPLAADHGIGPLADEVAAWVRAAGVAPKSIGVEFIESLGKLALTLGYRDDEPGYEVSLRTVNLGRIEGFSADHLEELESAMSGAAATQSGIICHELYVTADHQFVMVFMTTAS